MGNFDAEPRVTAAELAKGTWRTTGAKVMSLLLEKSNVDLAGNFEEIVIVPDGLLWYLPFEALSVGKGDDQRLLISQARVRYAPTVGLAVPYTARTSRGRTWAWCWASCYPQDDDSRADRGVRAIGSGRRRRRGAAAYAAGASVVYRTLLDGLIVLDDIEPADGPYDWSPAQIDRGKPGELAGQLVYAALGRARAGHPARLPHAGRSGLRKSSAAGKDMFLSLCGLMSTGARTILISRWRTGGQIELRPGARVRPGTAAHHAGRSLAAQRASRGRHADRAGTASRA